MVARGKDGGVKWRGERPIDEAAQRAGMRSIGVSGMADNVSVVIRSTLLQILTPPEMLGRVSAVNSVFIGSSNELGAFESGVAAKLLGTVPAVVFGGASALLVVGLTAHLVPKLRRLGRIVSA